jgi:hypothetical protein
MLTDAHGEPLKNGDTVAFIRGKLMIIGKIIKISGYKVTVRDENPTSAEYELKSHKVTKLNGAW